MIAEPCTTWSGQRRHLSTDLAGDPATARSGLTLCGKEAVDQAYLARYRPSASVTVADLPECRSCAKAWRAAKLRSGTSKSAA